VPVLREGRLAPRPVTVRGFAVGQADGYAVMPGGLARVGEAECATWAFSPNSGSPSKDVWVLAPGPVRPETLLATGPGGVTITREGGEVASRVAESLFWMGRYAARSEAGARLLREALSTFVEGDEQDWDAGLAALLRAVTTVTHTEPGFLGEGAEGRLLDPEPELLAVVGDPQRSGSLRFNLLALGRNAREVRDRLSADAWRVVSELGAVLDHTPEAGYALEELERVVLYLAAFTGLSVESMSRGQGWRFLDAGWRLERALQTLALVRSLVAPAPGPEDLRLDTLLAATDSVMTYRRRYRTHLERAAVLDLVLLDEDNPRSVAYQLAALQIQLPRYPETGPAAPQATHREALAQAVAELRGWDPRGDDGGAAPAPRDPLFGLLERLEQHLEAFCAGLTGLYFTHIEAPRQLTGAP
jgi:uncharacterized alpha-E superfamily protein